MTDFLNFTSNLFRLVCSPGAIAAFAAAIAAFAQWHRGKEAAQCGSSAVVFAATAYVVHLLVGNGVREIQYQGLKASFGLLLIAGFASAFLVAAAIWFVW